MNSATVPLPPPGLGQAAECYGIWSRINFDEVVPVEGMRSSRKLGGAGTYAALGARMAAGSGPCVTVISRVGEDILAHYGDWFSRWAIDLFPGVLKGEQTPRSRLVYAPDAERVEYPSLGEEHFDLFELGVGEVPAGRLQCTGLYVFRQADPEFWERVRDSCSGTTVLWEIDRRSCRPECWRDVVRVLPFVDMFSINRAELSRLYGRDDGTLALDALRSAFDGVLLYRMGHLGSYVAAGNRVLHVGAAPRVKVVDPTGAGNAYGGAFLASWCRNGRDLDDAARRATAIAGLVVGCSGPLENLGVSLGRTVEELARATRVCGLAVGCGKGRT